MLRGRVTCMDTSGLLMHHDPVWLAWTFPACTPPFSLLCVHEIHSLPFFCACTIATHMRMQCRTHAILQHATALTPETALAPMQKPIKYSADEIKAVEDIEKERSAATAAQAAAAEAAASQPAVSAAQQAVHAGEMLGGVCP